MTLGRARGGAAPVDEASAIRFRVLGVHGSGGDGARLLHYRDVHDQDFAPLGQLDSSVQPWRVAVSDDSRVALVFEMEGRVFRSFDLSADGGPFPERGTALPLPENLGAPERLVLDDDGHTAFVFTYGNEMSPSAEEYRLVVRNVVNP